MILNSCVTSSLNNNVIRGSEVVEFTDDIKITDPQFSDLINTLPEDGNLTFFTAVPRMGNRDDELLYGKYEIAKQIVMHSKLGIFARFATKSSNRNHSTLEDIKLAYDKDAISGILDDIEIITHIRDRQGSYFKGKYTASTSGSNINLDKAVLDQHDWMYNIPKVDGYLVSVGTVERSRYQIDSINRSDEQAVTNLAKQLHVEVKNKNDQVDNDLGFGMQDIKYEETTTSVRNFYVLHRWVTDNGRYFHTLAICKPE